MNFNNDKLVSIEFNSNNNKSVLWEMLVENNEFMGLNDVEQVKDLFENTITITDGNHATNNILEKNKIFLKDFIRILSNMRKRSTSNVASNVAPNVTRSDIQQARNNQFESNLKNRQEEFTDLITQKKPTEIDFSDKDGDINNGNVNDIFMSIEEKRKKELESITTNYNTNSNNDNVMKWLNQNDNKQGNNKQGNNKQDNNNHNNNNQNIHIKIENEVIDTSDNNKGIIPLTNDKQVSFNLSNLEEHNNNTINNTMNNTMNTTSVDEKLNTIITKIDDLSSKYDKLIELFELFKVSKN
tara:strand:+ start:639 stop:1532 length:894 start_codon:yes stop_codon:yes gene_type:complete